MRRFIPQLRVVRPSISLLTSLRALDASSAIPRFRVRPRLLALRGATVEVGWLGDDGASIIDDAGTVIDAVADGDFFQSPPR